MSKHPVVEHFEKETEALLAKHPEWRDDPAKAQAELAKMREGVTKHYGFEPHEVQYITDHRLVDMARDAVAHKDHLARQTAEQAALKKKGDDRSAQDEAAKGRSRELRANVKKTRGLHDKADAITSFLDADQRQR